MLGIMSIFNAISILVSTFMLVFEKELKFYNFSIFYCCVMVVTVLEIMYGFLVVKEYDKGKLTKIKDIARYYLFNGFL